MQEDSSTGTELLDLEVLLSHPMLIIRDLGVKAERLLEARLAARGVSLMEFRILMICVWQPGITAVDISNTIPVEPPAISRLVHQLVQKRLLYRNRSRADRRTVLLRTSDEGLTLFRECQTIFDLAVAEFLSPLSQAQANAYLRSAATLLTAGS